MVTSDLVLGWESLHLRLKRARQRLGLSQRRLCVLAGMSYTAIQLIERGKRAPGVDTVERLAIALGVSKCWLAYGEGISMKQDLRCWIAPDFDPIKMTSDLASVIRSGKGHIEQSFKYLDPAGAAAWCSITKQIDRAAINSSLPFQEIAKRIASQSCAPLDVIGLGAGTAQHEICLVSHLLRDGRHDIRLFVLDISQPLLSVAYQNLRATLAGQPGVSLTAMQGDFHKLSAYSVAFQSTQKTQRLLCMFGYTFGNLENEIRFLRNSLADLAANDMLLLDVTIARAPADQPAEILKKDPALTKRRPADYQRQMEEFMVTPLRRHLGEGVPIAITPTLDTRACTVPGSYAIDVKATIDVPGDRSKIYSIAYVKRYEPTQLIASLAAEGWRLVQNWKYGGEFDPAMLCLFKRTE